MRPAGSILLGGAFSFLGLGFGPSQGAEGGDDDAWDEPLSGSIVKSVESVYPSTVQIVVVVRKTLSLSNSSGSLSINAFCSCS